MSAFYTRDGARLVSSELTRGPWDVNAQHGGPPSALIAHEISRAHPREEMMIARAAIAFLKPVPIAPLEIATRVARPGKNFELIEAMVRAGGDDVIHASVVRIRSKPVELTPVAFAETPAGPEHGKSAEFFSVPWTVGYHTSIDCLFVSGAFLDVGPATAWFRARYPLVEGEPWGPASRVLLAADSGNGIAAPLDARRWVFINPELTVHLSRLPEGEWVCLDAKTTLTASSVGLSESALFDTRGPIGSGRQSLLITPR